MQTFTYTIKYYTHPNIYPTAAHTVNNPSASSYQSPSYFISSHTYKNPQTPNPTPASKAAEPSILSIPAASLNVAGLALPLVALVVAVVVPVGADLVAPDVDAPAPAAEPVGVVPAPAAPEDAALTVTPTLPHSFWENSATSVCKNPAS